jgi:hypothetical protein
MTLSQDIAALRKALLLGTNLSLSQCAALSSLLDSHTKALELLNSVLFALRQSEIDTDVDEIAAFLREVQGE